MHQWQDIVFAVGSLIFSAALIPSVKGDDKPAFWTSAVTAIILATYIVAFATLRLWFSTFATALNCTIWTTLAVQKYLHMRSKIPKK